MKLPTVLTLPTISPQLEAFLLTLPPRVTPVQIIQHWSEVWKDETSLHRGLTEEQLLEQLVTVLRAADVHLVAEPRGWKGHADLVVEASLNDVPRFMDQVGRSLVANAVLWTGPIDFGPAIERLLPQINKADREAALIVFVRQGGLEQVMQIARFACEKHRAFGNFGRAAAENQMKLWLSISKNPDKVIPTTLLFCDLFEGVNRGGVDEPDGEEPWNPDDRVF